MWNEFGKPHAHEAKFKVMSRTASSTRSRGVSLWRGTRRRTSRRREIENPEVAESAGILEEVFGPTARAPSKAEKEAVDKLHRNLEHPNNRQLSRALSISRASPHLIKCAKESFKCPSCEAHRAPKWNRPTTVPKSCAPNVVMGVDLFQMPSHDGPDGSQALWMLNMICMGTSYQLVERVRSKENRTRSGRRS